MNAFCTACGAPRMPLASSSVTLAGQPSKVGGTVARVLGWLVLAGGVFLTGLLVFIFLAINATGLAAWVGGAFGLVTLVAAYALLRGGKSLAQSGDDEELATKKQAIFALANTRGGVLRAADVGHMLHVSPVEGDAILTKLAKEDPDRVGVDIDDDGNILYRFNAAAWAAASGMAPNAHGAQLRVAPPMRVADAPSAAAEELEDEPDAARRSAVR